MDCITNKLWIPFIPATFGLVAFISSVFATFGCQSVQYTPLSIYNNNILNSTDGSILISDVYFDPTTNVSWSLRIPPPITLHYAPYRQTSFGFNVSIETITAANTTTTSNSRRRNLSTKLYYEQQKHSIFADQRNVQEVSQDDESDMGTNVATVEIQFLQSCRQIPLHVTNIDFEWKYSRVVGVIVPLIGSGCVLMFLFVQPFCPFIGIVEYKVISFIFLLCFTTLQGSTLIFYTNSNACTNYPPLQEQFANFFVLALEEKNITLTTIDPSVFWQIWIQNTYNPQCEWDVGSTWNVLSTFFWFTTSLFMFYFGPTHFKEQAVQSEPSVI